MRTLALLAILVLLSAPVLAQANNTTGQANETQDNQTPDNGTADNTTPDDGEEPPPLPERQGHIPWTGLIVGVLAFFGAVVISRETDTGGP